MSDYWRKVLSTAWADTWKLLNWDRAKVGSALLSVAGVVAAALHLGVASGITAGNAAFWAAAPIAIVAPFAFLWGVIQAQAKLCNEVATKLAKADSQEPNWAAVRLQHQYPLRHVARLWMNLDPSAQPNYDSSAWLDVLTSAIQQGNLPFEARRPDKIKYEQQNPDVNTLVTRDALKRYAASIGQDPRFLRDSD